MNKPTVKLQTFMAHSGIASVRKSEEFIREGKVFVNGKKAHIGQRVDPKKVEVVFEGKKVVQNENFRYFLIDKPKGYVSTTSDEMGRKTVLNLLPEKIDERLYPVGRLDIDSEGLLLLTNDGKLAQTLTHPKFEIEKTYHVLIDRQPSFRAINHLRKGVKIKGEYTLPAEVKILSAEKDLSDDQLEEESSNDVWLEITITEGKNRQIRNMMDRVGYPVVRLVRISMGPLHIDMLDGGQVIELSEEQVEKLKSVFSAKS
jgi:23S rRNA pseudouridine2605 synthase